MVVRPTPINELPWRIGVAERRRRDGVEEEEEEGPATRSFWTVSHLDVGLWPYQTRHAQQLQNFNLQLQLLRQF